MKNESGSTIIIIILIVGMFFLFNSLKGGSCSNDAKNSQSPPPALKADSNQQPSELSSQPQIQADSLVLQNKKLKISLIAWQYRPGFRISRVELKNFKKNKEINTTERIPVTLLDKPSTFFDILGKTDSSYQTLRFEGITDTSITLVWMDTLDAEKQSIKIPLYLSNYELHFTQQDSTALLRVDCENGLNTTEPRDKSEKTLFQLYYYDGQNNVGWLNISKIKKYEKGKLDIESGPYKWLALRTKYFAAILMPSTAVTGRIEPKRTFDSRIGLSFNCFGSKDYTLFFGPLDYDLMAQLGKRLHKPRLTRIVELGGSAFRWLGVAILKLFQFLYKLIPNYGIAIIIFSILIKLIFLPLSRSQQQSMHKMQMIQPKIKEIQERFKDDQQRQYAETQRLYKNHGVSPLGGCLPMLIQMPVFFGLYGVLRNNIALRGAPFVNLFHLHIDKAINLFNFIRIPAGDLVWLADLSQHDPFYILPILMGIASIIQALRTNVDPKQRTTAFIFPIIITAVFLNFPSGLQLYWLIFNVLSIIESTVFKRGRTGGIQWEKQQNKEIPSGKNLQKSSRS